MNLLVYLTCTQFLTELFSNHKTGKSNLAFAELKSNQDAWFINRLQINVTVNYTSYLFFIFEGIL